MTSQTPLSSLESNNRALRGLFIEQMEERTMEAPNTEYDAASTEWKDYAKALLWQAKHVVHVAEVDGRFRSFAHPVIVFTHRIPDGSLDYTAHSAITGEWLAWDDDPKDIYRMAAQKLNELVALNHGRWN